MQEERKKGKLETDFLEAKEITERAANGIKQKFAWIKSFRFAGDVSFHSKRTKASVKEAAERGEEVSFGLNMIMTYVDEQGVEKETEVLIKYRPFPFIDILFKAYTPNSTLEDVCSQFKNIWIILASGGTPEMPSAYIVTKLGEYSPLCFKATTRNRWKIAFAKWLKWKPCITKLDLFGKDIIVEEFKKIRRG